MRFSDIHHHLQAGELPVESQESGQDEISWKQIQPGSKESAKSAALLERLISQECQNPGSSSTETSSMLDRYITLEHIRFDIENLVKQRLLKNDFSFITRSEAQMKEKVSRQITVQISQVLKTIDENKVPSQTILNDIVHAGKLNLVEKNPRREDPASKLWFILGQISVNDSDFWIEIYDAAKEYPLLQAFLQELHLDALVGDGYLEPIFKQMEAYGLSLDAPFESGATLLQMAIATKNYQLVNALFARGASPDVVDNNFKLALDYTVRGSPINHAEILSDVIDPVLELESISRDISDADLKKNVIALVRQPVSAYGKLPKTGPSGFSEVLKHLCSQDSWIERHPNVMTILLNHAVRDMLPASDLLPFLDACRGILQGQRGRNVLYLAIETDKPIIAERLISIIGEAAFHPYGSPLATMGSHKIILGSDMKLYQTVRTFTPLQHAFVKHQLEIAELLLKSGAAIDDPNLLGNTLQDMVSLESGTLLFSRLELRWLFSLLPADNPWVIARKEAFLNEAIASNDITNAYYWIKQGAALNVDQEVLVSKALNKEQKQFVEFLWEKGYLTKLSDAVFVKILSFSDSSWAQAFLERIRPSITLEWENSSVIHNAVDRLVQNHQFLFVASLIVNGYVNLEEITTYKQEIGCLVDSLQNCSASERSFRSVVNEKNLGHLIGDSFLNNMTDDHGNRLEGNLSSTSIDFLMRILRYHYEKNPGGSARFEKEIARLEQARKIAISAEAIMRLDAEEITATHDLTEEILGLIENLPIEETVLIPAGWFSTQASGHSIAINCKKLPDNIIEIQIINTGEGLERHENFHDTGRLHANTVVIYHVPFDRLKNNGLLQGVLEPFFASRLYLTGAKRFRPDEVYNTLSEFKVSSEAIGQDQLIKGWRKAQLAGTCSLRSLLAYLYKQLDPQAYQELIDACKEDALTKAVEQYSPFVRVSPSFRKLLTLGLAGGYDTHIKRIGKVPVSMTEEHFLRLESSKRRLEKVLPANESVHDSLEQRVSFQSETFRVAMELSRLQGVFGTALAIDSPNPEQRAPSFWDKPIRDISNVAELKALLNMLKARSGDFETTPAYLTTPLREVGRLFVNASEQTENFLKLQDELKNSPDACMEIITLFTDVVKKLAMSDGSHTNQDPHPETSIAFNYALVVCWTLAIMIDEQVKPPPDGSLNDYAINLINSVGWMESKFQTSTVLDPAIENDMITLRRFTEKQSNKRYLFLNDNGLQLNRSQLNRSSCTIIPSNPLYSYILAHMDPEASWTSVDEGLEKACDNFRSSRRQDPDISKEEWRVNWVYFHNRLPPYFTFLNTLATYARWSKPWLRAASARQIDGLQPERLVVEADTASREKTVKAYAVYKSGFDHPNFNPATYLPRGYGVIEKDAVIGGGLRSYLCLDTFAQNQDIVKSSNRIHRDLMGIRLAINNPRSTTGIPLLIDYFERHKDYFIDPALRIFFEMSLFCPMVLVRLIRMNEESVREVASFFERAIMHYEENVATNMDKAGSVDVVAFLLTQQQRLCNYVLTFGTAEKSRYENILTHNRKKIETLLHHPDYQANSVQRHLHLALLDSYHSDAVLNFDDVKHILLSTAGAARCQPTSENTEFESPALISSAMGVPFTHALQLREQLEQNPEASNALFNHIASLYNLVIPLDAQWNCQSFPFCTCEAKPGIVYTFDVTSGALTRNNLPIKGVPANTKSSKEYRLLFGNKELAVAMRETSEATGSSSSYRPGTQRVLESVDEYGQIEIEVDYYFNIRGSVRRQLNGIWYSYVSDEPLQVPSRPVQSNAYNYYTQKEEDEIYGDMGGYSSSQKVNPIPSHPSISGVENLIVWKSDTAEPHYLWIDPKTMQPKMRIDSDGILTFPDENDEKRWEWISLDAIQGGRAIKAVDSGAYVLQEVTPGAKKEMRLIFPHLKSIDGKPLEFTIDEPIGLKEEKWVLKGQPHLFMSTSQRLPGIHGFNGFLILESVRGSREALIPIKSLNEMQSNNTYTTWIQVKIKGDKLVTKSPRDNAYLAYITLLKATTPKDYINALEFLKNVHRYRFEGFNFDEFKMLGAVFQSRKETKDKNVYADLCRLYTAWIVHDNITRNPINTSSLGNANLKGIAFRDPPLTWKKFWISETRSTLLNTQSRVAKNARRYFSRCQHLPFSMRIENLISPFELENWGIGMAASRYGPRGNIDIPRVTASLPTNALLKINSAFHLTSMDRPKHFELVTRPKDVMNEFPHLFNDALSSDPKRIQHARDRLNELALFNDPDPVLVCTVLFAALTRRFNANGRRLIELILEVVNNPNMPGDLVRFQSSDFDSLLMRIKTDYISNPNVDTLGYSPDIPQAQILPEKTTIQLPDAIPHRQKIPFKNPSIRIHDLEEILISNFEARFTRASSAIVPFLVPENDPGLESSVEDLNREYALGSKKNAANPTYVLRQGMTPEQLVMIEKPKIDEQITEFQSELKSEEEAILIQANELPEGAEGRRLRAELASGKKTTLTMRECVGLFLQADEGIYRKVTHLKDSHSIRQLHERIGAYIQTHNRLNRYLAAGNVLTKLESATSEQEKASLIQQLGQELSLKQEVQPGVDPEALLVFEYALGLLLKSHQIEGIRDMLQIDETDPTKFRSVLLQRIQGGGKSLVFGHIMALLKADGFHLSIHVPATAQYATAIYDMSQMSRHLFDQRERTLDFDDNPYKFTVSYLTHVKRTLEEVIVSREYITITNESLRALRCKYLKTFFEIQQIPNEEHKEHLRRTHKILGEILLILRTRGVFTVDEGHLALDPNKDLDMPFGVATHPNLARSELISKIVRFACLATDAEGKPLLNIQRTSEQSPREKQLTLEAVIEGLTQDPEWSHPDIARYLRGEITDIPTDLDTDEMRPFSTLVVLAKQMIAGQWLQERLSSNINEHHGLTDDRSPRISCPFVANMKPAEEGSEFSDADVMTTNTFLAYLATGLDEMQTADLIRRAKLKAISEKRRLRSSQPNLSIENTESAQRFLRATGYPLFSIDAENDQDAVTVQAALMKRNPDAMNIMLSYVIATEFPEVNLYEHQVSSNGQNTFSMAQSSVSYSGSVENTNMAPVGMAVKLEAGTNGETIDLLISQNTQVVAVDSHSDALFTDIISKHPRKDDVHAIIDVGAHYRGMNNNAVARNICGHLKWLKMPSKGVLFFDSDTDKLCFMDREKPHEFRFLSGSSAAIIEEETGFSTDELFTYYDQAHTTGVDIPQHPNAIAIMTISIHTTEHELCQASRRLRGLGKGQEIVVACPKGAVEPINASLNNPVDHSLNIRDVILYGRIKEALSQRPNNFLFTLQKIENIPQQRIYDRLIQLPQEESEVLFAKVSYLFDKNILVDIYREYAKNRLDIPVIVYLEKFIQSLLGPLQGVCSPEEIQEMREIIYHELLNEEKLAGLEPTVSVPHDFEDNPNKFLSNRNRQTTHVQHQQSIQQRTEISQNVSQQEQQNQYVRQMELRRRNNSTGPTQEISFGKEAVTAPGFGIPEAIVDIGSAMKNDMFSFSFSEPDSDGLSAGTSSSAGQKPAPKIWHLENTLSLELPGAIRNFIFDERLLTTSNASLVLSGKESSLVGPLRKAPWPVLLIRDESAVNPQWRLILCSVQEGINFENWLSDKSLTIPSGKKMWMLRSNGKAMPKIRDWDPALLEDPSLAVLFVEAMLFSGDWQTLSQEPWLKRFTAWYHAMEPEQKSAWGTFFEQNILMGDPPGYKESEVYELLHSPM